MEFLSKFKAQPWKKDIFQTGSEINKIIKPTQIYKNLSPFKNIGKKLTEHQKSVSFSESKLLNEQSLLKVRKRKLLRGRLSPVERWEGFRTPKLHYEYTL